MSGGGGMESVVRAETNLGSDKANNGQHRGEQCGYFQMPLHYPRYSRADYETMPEWKIDCLLREYGLPFTGNFDHKRNFAMGAFLWSH